eukprot:6205666-Pleurochrysis_carterae.AAC.1
MSSHVSNSCMPTEAVMSAHPTFCRYGVGAGLLISPMFISEIAPPKFRGSLVTLSEVSLSLGVLLAFVVNFALGGNWRWMLALGAAPGAPQRGLQLVASVSSPTFRVRLSLVISRAVESCLACPALLTMTRVLSLALTRSLLCS